MTTSPVQVSQHLYNLFQSLSDETRQAFLQSLVEHNREELETVLFYLDCQVARTEGFLSESEAQDFIASLPE